MRLELWKLEYIGYDHVSFIEIHFCTYILF